MTTLPLSQRARVLVVVALTALPLMLLTGLVLVRLWLDGEERVARDRLALARALAATTDAYVEGHLNTIVTLAATRAARDPRVVADTEALLADFLRVNPEWSAIALFGPDGRNIASTAGPPGTIDVTDRSYFRHVLETGTPILSEAVIGRPMNEPLIALAAPVDLVGGGRAVIAAALPAESVARHVRILPPVGEMRVELVDQRGQLFVHPDPDRARMLTSARGRRDVEAALSGRVGTTRIADGGPETLVAYAPVLRTGWGVLLLEPTASAFAAERRDAATLAGLGIVTLAVAVAVGWVLAGRLATVYQRALDARAEAEAANAAREDLVAAVSHDLRNPLTVARGRLQQLRRRVLRATTPLDPAAVAADLTRIDRSIDALADQIEELVDTTRLRLGQPLALRRERADIVTLTSRVVDEHVGASERHRLIFEPAAERLEAPVDAARLRRVLGNLLSNAVKYSPGGGDVRVRVAPDGQGWATIAVTDHGIGVPPCDHERLFERFHRGSNVPHGVGGSGLGLAGARQIVEQHGGTVALESRPGVGSTFVVRLPLTTPPTDLRA